eukprot:jgi/Tetstr1/454247/TSEL_041166.t1
MSAVQLFSEFQPSSLEEGSVRNLDNGAKIVFLNHGPDRSPVILQTGTLRTIKGIESNDFGDGPTKHTMELALAPEDPEYQKLAAMDEAIVNLAFHSKQKWLKSKTGAAYSSIDMVRDKYTPTLRIPRDKEGNVTDRWPPSFRVTIPQDRNTGAFNVEVWDSKRRRIDASEFIGQSRNAQVTVIARCTGIWVAGNAFGVSWKAQQILVHAAGRSAIASFAFIGADKLLDEDADADAGAIAPVKPPARTFAPSLAAATAAAAGPCEDDEYLEDSD